MYYPLPTLAGVEDILPSENCIANSSILSSSLEEAKINHDVANTYGYGYIIIMLYSSTKYTFFDDKKNTCNHALLNTWRQNFNACTQFLLSMITLAKSKKKNNYRKLLKGAKTLFEDAEKGLWKP